MDQKLFYAAALAAVFLLSCQGRRVPQTKAAVPTGKAVIIRPDFLRHFENCRAEGSIALYHHNTEKWFLSDTAGTTKQSLPASTFKIINLLIALETRVIRDENEVVKWPGTTDTVKYGYRPEIYHDMPVKEAFAVSAGWVFIELAKRIGRANYKKYLALCQYGNGDLSQPDDDFWNFGGFAISPVGQVQFLQNLYTGNLPFSRRNIAIVKKVMITEQNENYTLGSKTGWTRDGGINTGWWVGYVRRNGAVYFFATRLLQDRKKASANFGSCRKESTRSILRELTILP